MERDPNRSGVSRCRFRRRAETFPARESWTDTVFVYLPIVYLPIWVVMGAGKVVESVADFGERSGLERNFRRTIIQRHLNYIMILWLIEFNKLFCELRKRTSFIFHLKIAKYREIEPYVTYSSYHPI